MIEVTWQLLRSGIENISQSDVKKGQDNFSQGT